MPSIYNRIMYHGFNIINDDNCKVLLGRCAAKFKTLKVELHSFAWPRLERINTLSDVFIWVVDRRSSELSISLRVAADELEVTACRHRKGHGSVLQKPAVKISSIFYLKARFYSIYRILTLAFYANLYKLYRMK